MKDAPPTQTKPLRGLAAAIRPFAEGMKSFGEAMAKKLGPVSSSLQQMAQAIESQNSGLRELDWTDAIRGVRLFEERRAEALNQQCIKNNLPPGDFETLAAIFHQRGRLKRRAGEDAQRFCQRYLMKTNPAWNGKLLPRDAFKRRGRPRRLNEEKITKIESFKTAEYSAWKACYLVENDEQAANETYRQYLRLKKK